MPQEVQESTSETLAADIGTPVTPEKEKPAEGDSPNEESFTLEYVQKLRTEAKDNRLAAARADFLATEVRRLATREAVRGVLTDPEALTWLPEFEGEDGLPDHDRLKAAAEELAREKPWLARARGDIGQGRHSDTLEAMSLSALLRA